MTPPPVPEQTVVQLRMRLEQMGARVEQMLDRSLRALEAGDEGLAHKTIAQDRRVNQDEIEIDALCTGLILGGGLDLPATRLVMAAAKMVADLERIGDLAVDICELTLAMEETGIPGDMDELRRIGDLVLDMLRGALSAFARGDAVAAQVVIDRDDTVDRAYRAFLADLLARASDVAEHPERFRPHAGLRWYLPEQSIAKMLERAADHATNVAEQTIFLAQGRDIRHVGKRIA